MKSAWKLFFFSLKGDEFISANLRSVLKEHYSTSQQFLKCSQFNENSAVIIWYLDIGQMIS